jgi:hypothetical protein
MASENPSPSALRSRGESRLRRLTIWAGLGAMVATGAAAAGVAHAIPGRSSASTVSGATAPSGSLPGNSAGSGAGVSPGTAPAPSAATPAVTSGGS